MALLRSLGSRHMCRVPSGLLGLVSDDTQVVGLVTGAINSFQDHVIQSLFNLVPVLNWDFPPGMLHWGNRSVSLDDIGTGHITYGTKRVWKGSFQDHNVPFL